ncbi:hypothetical protein DMJ27_07320 [Vibrio parahaemolyticus]|nr:hypothetical protein [Vibrio parahaemolyticus]
MNTKANVFLGIFSSLRISHVSNCAISICIKTPIRRCCSDPPALSGTDSELTGYI